MRSGEAGNTHPETLVAVAPDELKALHEAVLG